MEHKNEGPAVPSVTPTSDFQPAPSTLPHAQTASVGMPSAPAMPGYAIEAVLGRGGMGVVYRARHLGLGRTVALKMLLAGDHADANEQERFKAEARAVAQFQHPHIVQIFEVGEHEGRLFFSLEFVEGGSLAQRLAGTPLAARQAADLVETLARAVHYAHERNLIHRDLKPANILLARDDGTARPAPLIPKITDFGLAKQLDSDNARTQTGAIMGTPSYMAPEQAAGRLELLGPRTDVYALGAILYECLTGRPPFRGTTTMETLAQVLEREPVPVRKLNPAVPRNLETVCLKCLRKEPARRYATALELAQDLHRFLAGEPVWARRVGTVERAWVWARRRPMAAMAAVLAVCTLCLGAGGGLALWLYQTAEAGRLRAEAAEAKEKALRQEADGQRQQAELAQQRIDRILTLERVQGAVREWQASNVVQARALLEECPAPRRDWEWHYVHHLLYPLREIPGLLAKADHLQFTPDGKRLVASGAIEGLRVWDPDTGRDLYFLEDTQPKAEKFGAFGSSSPQPQRFAIDPGRGEILASFRWGPIWAWDLATGKKRRQLAATSGQLKSCLAIDPKGSWLAFGCGGGNVFAPDVYLVDLATGKDLPPLKGHATPVLSVATNADGTLLASGCSAGLVIVWNMKERKIAHKLQTTGGAVVGLAFRPGSAELVGINRRGALHCWDTVSGLERYNVSTRPRELTALAMRPDGQRLACGTDHGEIRIYDPSTGDGQEIYRGHLEPYRGVTALAYNPDGTRLISAGLDHTLRVWDVTQPPECRRRKIPLALGAGIALHPRTGSLVTASQNGTLRRWTVATGEPCEQLQSTGAALPGLAVAGLAAADLSERVAWATIDGTVRVWDWAAGKQVLALERVADRIHTLVLTADGTTLVVSGAAGQGSWLRAWEVDTAKEIPLPQPQATIHKLAFSPEGRMLAAGDDAKNMFIWRFPQCAAMFHYQGAGNVAGLAFSHDGQYLAAAVRDRLRVWHAGDRKEVVDARVRGTVELFAFHPDHHRLATSGDDVTVWDLTTGQQAVTLPASTRQMTLRFSADGHTLVGATLDGTVTFWDASPKGP